MASRTLRLCTIRPTHSVRHAMESADHQPVLIEAAASGSVQWAHDPLHQTHGIMDRVKISNLSRPVKDLISLLFVTRLYPPEQIEKFRERVMIEPFLATVLVAAITAETVACSSPVIRLAHPVIEVPDPDGIYFDGFLVCGEKGRKNAHALLHGLLDIMSQAS